ncbi:HlyD family secretion protein [Prochlorococcus marinus]|uniref:HlyD family secretion protein n=1 Tax=Prochlorococcus marinus TaxID=1219 RepID=UPI0007B3F5F6|nr:HlyD family efflux transporter periplasmic adaptor subunit [Prochlorococcus marinus]KZR73261.1 Hemolysin secretion protein D, chromosomal [Prochlorococcus marinus str. MIT 1320]
MREKPLDDASSSSSDGKLAKAQTQKLTLKQRSGDAANRWLEKNRNLVLRQTPVWAQSISLIFVSLGTLALAGGIFFKIDEVVTVKGQLESIGGTVEVKTPAGGRVAEVLFKDGEVVAEGQLLLRFDTRQAADEKDTLTRLIALEENALKINLDTLDRQQLMLDGRRDVMNQKLKTKYYITEELKRLVIEGGYQKLTYLEQRDQLFELRKQITELDAQKEQIRLQGDQMKLSTQKSVNEMRNRLRLAELQLQYQNVTAPAAGIVFDPKARTEGVIQAGERILSIVPQKGLYAEVLVPNYDIGFVKTGQKAKVHVDAFPYTRYGELQAKVTQIAADALPPDSTHNFYRFPVKLHLERSYLENKGVKVPLLTGMSITSNLKLREKRVISLISDLLVDQTESIKSIRQQ